MADAHQRLAATAPAGGTRCVPAGSSGALALLLALLALTLALVLARHAPPPPRSADAPAVEFSAARARQVLGQLVADGRPHPVGSPEDGQVRARIVAVLNHLGCAPHVEEGFACNRLGACARVSNVVAGLRGREPGPAVAIVAHYDSVPAGPGASDDLAGVAAILEVARALRARPPLRHPVLLLLDEGEEPGLLGAEAFARSSPQAAAVRAVVNLEARGTRGPSFMFETSGENRWLIESWAPRVSRPVTNSVAAFLYTLLPNDTDLTVFRRNRVPGLNFAFIGGAANYHTSGDSFDNASPASLQHQGDNALAAVTGLAEADLVQPPRGSLVYFDLLSLGIVRWPEGWTLALAIAALLAVLAAAVTALRRRAISGRDLLIGLLMVPATVTLSLLAAGALAFGLAVSGALVIPWLAHPAPALTAFWLLGLAAVAVPASRLGRRSVPQGMWAGIWITWAALGVALAVTAPAVSYLFIVPSLAAGLCGALPGIWCRRAGSAAAVILPALAAALTWFGVVPTLYDGFGSPALPLVAVLAAVLFTAGAPLIAGGGALGRRLWAAALGLALAAAVVALLQPRYTALSPQPLDLVFYQDADSGKALWVALPPPLPAAMLRAAAFGRLGSPFPWVPAARGRSAPAAALIGAAGLDLRVIASTITGGRRHLRLRLTSHPGATRALLEVPAAARPDAVTIDGQEVPASAGRTGIFSLPGSGWRSYQDLTLPAAGCEIEMTLGNVAPLDWYVIDVRPGLPASGAALQAARPPTAAAFQEGDRTLISRKVRI